MLSRIQALFVSTFLEGIRSRVVYGIFLLSLLIFGITLVFSGFFMRDISKVAADLSLGGLSLSGALLVFFASINLMSKDIEKKIICLVLSRPFSRLEYLTGKFLGLLAFSFVAMLVILIMSLGCMGMVKISNPDYFQGFSWGMYLLAAFFIFVQVGVLNSFVIFFSSISTSSFVTLICSFSFFLVGRSIESVILYLQSPIASQEVVDSDRLLVIANAISYIIPNLSALDFTMEAAHGLSVPLPDILWPFSYAAMYCGALVMLAALFFRRREFF